MIIQAVILKAGPDKKGNFFTPEALENFVKAHPERRLTYNPLLQEVVEELTLSPEEAEKLRKSLTQF